MICNDESLCTQGILHQLDTQKYSIIVTVPFPFLGCIEKFASRELCARVVRPSEAPEGQHTIVVGHILSLYRSPKSWRLFVRSCDFISHRLIAL